MSEEVCLSPAKIKSDFDKISQILMYRYDKNIETQLQPDDEVFLNKIADKLSDLTNNTEINFNKEGFKTLIKKLYVYDFSQFGGMNGVAPYSNRRGPNKNDFVAIVALVVSIIFLYISFCKFDALSKSIIGISITDVSTGLRNDIADAISKTNNISPLEYTFVDYVWKTITTFGCELQKTQIERTKNLVMKVVTDTIENSVETIQMANKICNPIVEYVSNDAKVTVTKNIITKFFGLGDVTANIGAATNTAINYARTYVEGETISNCIVEETKKLTLRKIEDSLDMINYQTGTAINWFDRGKYLGTAAVGYLAVRVKSVLGIGSSTTGQGRLTYGGIKSRKGRKSKKNKKGRKTRKYKKGRKSRK